MSDRNFKNLDKKQRLAQEAVRSLAHPQADADFRARLKDQFLAGEIPETGLSSSDESPAVSPRPWLRWGGLAAAAVLAFVVFSLNRLPGPELVATNGVGTVTVDGRELAADDSASLESALRAGARLQVGEGGVVDIVYPGSFVMRLDSGTDMVLPSRPGRWFLRSARSAIEYGEISVRTGPNLAGGRLIVDTPEGRTAIHGTLVSVFRNDGLTCVCLFEGSASISTDEKNLGGIPLGMRWVLFKDGSEPQLLDIAPPHRDHMLGLDEAWGGIFDKE
jgi:ferric-dicitrate binding protein FerR (iron transport regulator)